MTAALAALAIPEWPRAQAADTLRSMRAPEAAYDTLRTELPDAAETRRFAAFHANPSVVERMAQLDGAREASLVQGRIGLMKHGYRVDPRITPKLARLAESLRKTLRLVLPLDVFVQPDPESNAYCLPSRKGNRLVMGLVSGLVSALNERELLFVMGHELGHALLRHGQTVRFGSVAGGRRYAGLVKRFTGQDVPATGFSIGVSRLMTALKNLGKLDDGDRRTVPGGGHRPARGPGPQPRRLRRGAVDRAARRGADHHDHERRHRPGPGPRVLLRDAQLHQRPQCRHHPADADRGGATGVQVHRPLPARPARRRGAPRPH